MSSTFGTCFKVTTFGESHCRGVGVVVDGCPPGMALSEEDIQPQLNRRRPGQSEFSTQRQEQDRVEIQSGVEKGKTLGTPIVHGPEEAMWAPGYYSILFEDPDGIRLEINHVPGKGLLA